MTGNSKRVLLWSAFAGASVQAFVSSSFPPLATLSQTTLAPAERSTLQWMSSTDGSSDDDEISRLIGKRNQIKRKKKEELETPLTADAGGEVRLLTISWGEHPRAIMLHATM
jgi:hypothetical protein